MRIRPLSQILHSKLDNLYTSTTIFVVVAKDPIKEYAKRYHSGFVRVTEKAANIERGLSWRDIPRKMVAGSPPEWESEPTQIVSAVAEPKKTIEPAPWARKKGYVYYAGDGHGRVKIGQSLNPWSRVSEMRCGNPSIEILVVEKSDNVFALEKERHEQFKDDHLALEWYRASESLMRWIGNLKTKDEKHEK